MTTHLRASIWQHNEMVAHSLLQRAGNPLDFGILVADTRDSLGGALMAAISERAGTTEMLRTHGEQIVAKGEAFQTGIVPLPIEALALCLAESNPRIASTLATVGLPDDRIYVVVIAEGGTTLLVARRPPKQMPSTH